MTKIANNSKCPVCNRMVKLIEIESDPDSGPGMGWLSYQVICNKCGSSGPYKEYGNSDEKKEYAIIGWNKLISRN